MRRIVMVMVSVLLCVLLCAGCGKQQQDDLQEQPAQSSSSDSLVTGLRNTVLYYVTDSTYVVPVMKRITWEEGIGKKAISCLMATSENNEAAAVMGLKTVLPEAAQYDLHIKEGVGRLNIDSASLETESAATERALVCCLVNTLCEFPSIQSVQICPDSKEKKELKNGTDISKPITKMELNIESMAGDVDIADAQVLSLYFIEQNTNVIVPVTRYLSQEPDLQSAVVEFISGPADKENLKNGIPEGTEVLDANIQDGVATIDFSQQFENIVEHPELEATVMKSLFMLCDQFADVQVLQITVEGKPFGEETTELISLPVFANTMQ